MTGRQSNKWARRFFAIWSVQAVSLLGSSVAQFAVVWWLTDTSGSAVVLATATLVAMLPQVLLGPFVGALVDRLDRRKVMIIADSVVAAFGLLLAMLFWTDRVQIWHLYVIMAARSLGGAFHWPAMQASTTLMVPEDNLPRVSGLNQALQGASQIISPPLGALLLALLPLHGMMMIDVVTAAIAVMPLFFIPIPQPEQAAEVAEAGAVAPLRRLWNDTREGLGYIWHWKGLRQVVTMAAGMNLIWAPAFTLMPLLVRNYFQRGALELGYTQAAWGAGVIAGGLSLAVIGGGRRPMRRALFLLIVQGLLILLVPSAPSNALWMALIGLATGGAVNAMVNGMFMAFMQKQVEPGKQGRVFTALSSFSGAMMPLGMVLAGPVAEAFGIRAWFFAAGVSSVLMACLGLLSRSIMSLDQDGAARLEGNGSGAPVEPAQADTLAPASAE